jgi:hypothetical protein
VRECPLRFYFLVLCLSLLVGCSTPVVKVLSVEEKPGISIHGAHPRAVVYVNGLSMGRAGQYDEHGKVLFLEPGTHDVEIVRRGTIIFTQQVVLSRGLQKIYVY